MGKKASDEAPFGQRLLRLRYEIEARIRVMCPHPIGSRAEKAWVAWARGIVFGCVAAQGTDTGPGGEYGTEACVERIGASSGRRGIRVCKDPSETHGSRGQQATVKQRFADDSRRVREKRN